MKIVVGLGNPGREYQYTRHNIGFWVIDYIADRMGCKVDRVKFRGLYGECRMGTEKVLLLKPQTYMNLSGECIRDAVEYYKLTMEDVIVVYDDISMEVGSLRIREKGSAGGHNGIKSIIYQTRSDQFPRVKVGVGGKPHPDYDLADWVLGQFTRQEEKVLDGLLPKCMEAVELLVAGQPKEAMNRCNVTVKKPAPPAASGNEG
ncbi:MAG: aminoacyl-tRNA hydrolase [Eubacteriales bacterium]|jgi:PTH1 family peptidyl-tRNA hydrolase